MANYRELDHQLEAMIRDAKLTLGVTELVQDLARAHAQLNVGQRLGAIAQEYVGGAPTLARQPAPVDPALIGKLQEAMLERGNTGAGDWRTATARADQHPEPDYSGAPWPVNGTYGEESPRPSGPYAYENGHHGRG